MFQMPLNEALVFSPAKPVAAIALHDALDRLADLDCREARVVELRYFGTSMEESPEMLEVFTTTVIRNWRLAKVWLKREFKEAGAHAG